MGVVPRGLWAIYGADSIEEDLHCAVTPGRCRVSLIRVCSEECGDIVPWQPQGKVSSSGR